MHRLVGLDINNHNNNKSPKKQKENVKFNQVTSSKGSQGRTHMCKARAVVTASQTI